MSEMFFYIVVGRFPIFHSDDQGSIPGGQKFLFLSSDFVCPLPVFCHVLSLAETLTLC